jgi:hypothetical protein
VSSERLMETTRGIARWVRLSGTEDELEAVGYVRTLLDGYGLETEVIFHDAYVSLPGAASFETEEGTLPCITHSFAISTPDTGLEGEVVDCGGEAPAGAGGRIALIDGLAGPEPVRRAEAAGAIAQIYVNGPRRHEMIVSPVWGSPGLENRSRLPSTPVVSVDVATGDVLRRRLRAGKATIRLHTRVDTGWRRTPILLASLPAAGRDEFVLFSGHIDSWHYGAMDNGTANATMVEVARIMAEHRDRLVRGLRLAFWSGHSHGRYSGSAWYADNHWLELRRHCVAHVNVDSVGGRGATVLSEGIAMASARRLGAEVIASLAGETFRGSRVGRAGDQSFVGLGVPSLWMSLSEQPPERSPTADAFSRLVGESRSGGLGWWWHTPEDTVDKIDPELLRRDARIYAAALARLLTSPLLPLDVAAEAQEILNLLRELAKAAGDAFDLSAPIEAAERVHQATERLDLWRQEKGESATAEEITACNRALREALHHLIPINYTAAGPFGHDPALTVPPLPLLAEVRRLAALPPDSDEARFLTVDLTRARNQVVFALVEARAELDEGLRSLPSALQQQGQSV